MNNIYLKKSNCFQWTNQKQALYPTSQLNYQLVQAWVKEYKLEHNQSKDSTLDTNKQRYRTHLPNSDGYLLDCVE